MTYKPTLKEIENLFVEETGFATDDFQAAIFDFARAVLAKWGQPSGAVPLPRAQVKAILVESGYFNADAQHKAHFMNGILHGEAAHGIKHGGQHGDAKP